MLFLRHNKIKFIKPIHIAMKPRLKITSIILFIILFISACSKTSNIEGNWKAVSSEGDYSELYFSGNKIRIYSEIAGIIGAQDYTLTKDSLKTNILTYKIKWVNPDSMILLSDVFTLNLKRINSGFKLSDFTKESLKQQYVDSFYKRMYKTKGINQNSIKHSSQEYPKIKEEIIEIN